MFWRRPKQSFGGEFSPPELYFGLRQNFIPRAYDAASYAG